MVQLDDAGLTSIWDAWVGLCISLIHGVLSVYHFLEGVQCNTHSTYNSKCLPSMTHLSIQGNTLDETSLVDSWGGKGVRPKGYLAQLQLPYL